MATSRLAIRDHQVFERARLARDTRFDGRFFVGVKTTGIYCRPICPANPPRAENVSFFPTAAAAAEAGYRPCLRCRPETAPGTPAWAGTSTTVQRALRLIASGALDGGSVEQLSDRLGVSSRHLRRLFREHLGASPQAVAHTQRLHFAKRLIDDTCLPLAEIADAAGYGSVRRFNDAFRNSYGRAPRELRKAGANAQLPDPSAPLSVALTGRKPFDWQGILDYLAGRAIPGVECVQGDIYRRSLRSDGRTGVLEIRPGREEGRLKLTLDGVTTAALYPSVQRARDLLDLDAPVADIVESLGDDPLLSDRLKACPGIRVPGTWDGFELAVRTILGQQVSVAAASTMAGRIAATFGDPLNAAQGPESDRPSRLFPTPRQLVSAPLERIGVVRTRAAAIRALSHAVVQGDIDFDAAQDPDRFARRLTEIKGIGEWTAAYLCMRVLKDPDAFPASDLGLRKAIDPDRRLSAGELSNRAENWRPWRAYAAMLLWQAPKAS